MLFVDFQCQMSPTWSSRRSFLCKIIPSRHDGSRNLAFPCDSGRGQWIHSSILTPIWLFPFDSHITLGRHRCSTPLHSDTMGMDLSCSLIRSGYLILLILVATLSDPLFMACDAMYIVAMEFFWWTSINAFWPVIVLMRRTAFYLFLCWLYSLSLVSHLLCDLILSLFWCLISFYHPFLEGFLVNVSCSISLRLSAVFFYL